MAAQQKFVLLVRVAFASVVVPAAMVWWRVHRLAATRSAAEGPVPMALAMVAYTSERDLVY